MSKLKFVIIYQVGCFLFQHSTLNQLSNIMYKMYHLGVWNKLDFLIYLIALVGFILKNISSTFQVARTLFAINAALLYIRLFRVYHASLQLGPKLVIFHRMIPEIITFMLLLIIFILGYGTASQEDLRKMSVWSLNFYQVILLFLE